MSSPGAVAGPVLRITAEGAESPRSARCFGAVRDLARRADAAGEGVESPLALHLRYAIDTPFALGTPGVWRLSSDWDEPALTFQAVLSPERGSDQDAEAEHLLRVALGNARQHAERTGLARSLDGLDRLVGDLTSARRPPAPPAGTRQGWTATTLPTDLERVAGWQREFQARRPPRERPVLASAFRCVVPRLPAAGVESAHAVLTLEAGAGVLARVRVPPALLAGLPQELASVTACLRFAADPDAPPAPEAASLRPSARWSEDGDAPAPEAELVRFGVELGVHGDGRRVGVLVLLDDAGAVTRAAATGHRLAVLGADLTFCLGMLRRQDRAP